MRVRLDHHHYKMLALAYLFFLTVLLLLPVGFFPDLRTWNINGVMLFFAYALLGWLGLAALGTCHLRRRRLVPWIAVIASAHAYWIEIAQGVWHVIIQQPSYADWALGTAGAFSGTFFKLKLAIRRCSCPLSSTFLTNYNGWKGIPFTGVAGVSALITHHPLLPGIISRAFGWKQIELTQKYKWRMQLVCTGRSLVSLPHFSYGALETIGDSSDPSGLAENYLGNMHFEKGFTGLEFRRLKTEKESNNALKTVNWLQLMPDIESQYLVFTSNLRRKIRKGYRNGMEVISGGIELLDRFYGVYARHIHKIGSAALPKRFFRLLLQEYNSEGGNATVFIVILNKQVVGGALSLSYQGFYENGWFATQKPAQKQYASYVLHDGMIRHAIKLGCHTYSFGRSTTESGVHRFKQQWNTADYTLFWLQVPDPLINIRKHQWLIRFWRLIPYPLSVIPARWVAKWIY